VWIDPEPNAQLLLVWLLSCFRGHEAASKLNLLQANVAIASKAPEKHARSSPPPVRVTDDHLDIASIAWDAYRATTPEAWFDLLTRDLSPLPKLRPAVLALLEELPWRGTGLGATELRLLELIGEGGAQPADVFPGHKKPNERRTLTIGRSASCWTGLPIVRYPRCPASRKDRSSWTCSTIVRVASDTGKADFLSPRWARRSWPGATISSGTTRSIAGGAALT
jgi:hypothetical protein